MKSSSIRRLIDFDGNRSNNFTLIRLVFAWAVLYGHSYAIQAADGYSDPLNRLFAGSTWVGAIAVEGFFAISGFLVTASLMKRDAIDYIISRSLRIVPGLTVCVFICVFLLGSLASELPISDYFESTQTFTYLRNSLAFIPMQWELPGVFVDNTRTAVNGSLWTLNVEVYCYVLLLVLGTFALVKYAAIANGFLVVLFLFSLKFYPNLPLIGINEAWARPSLYFLLGVFFYVNRKYIVLHWVLAITSLVLCLASFGKSWYQYVFPLAFVYLLFYTAYATKHIDMDRSLGDISFGFYIYAWPTQQVIASSLPSASPYINTLISTVITGALAWMSWTYVEKPALSLKQWLMNLRNGLKNASAKPDINSPSQQ
ncbi:acyltransferase [Gilvimarinus sp. DA14]|uniref:acyltransferase family protein n=1 Tax=Gilvimarinus sp. DA14 TaxID=2956798 RepID=UPI0020B8C260|nr:acyltransferase [Gilvimarinus sp. DA14]UTF58743.1 acyltransferase [Gilvimarinus sp. DA14]